jgi:acyl dehydratase
MTVQYTLEAFNTATASTNKIHDDAVAREYGFRGGLVPGVDVYAYMTHLPVAHWGRDWLERGTISVRLVQPVYDGERVTVTAELNGDEMHLATIGPDEVVRATGRATLSEVDAAVPIPPRAALPDVRPPASGESLVMGTVLGSLEATFDAGRAGEYLDAVREQLPIYTTAAVAHPGWLLRFANSILSANVELGPWIHVESDVGLGGVVEDGQRLEVRAKVLGESERRGHRFVELDVVVLADGQAVQRIAHTAIHTPRRLRHSSG